MKKKLLPALLLAAHITGCSTYANIPLRRNPDTSAPVTTQLQPMVGAKVRVTMADGGHVSGTLVEFSESGVTLRKSGNYGFREEVLAAADITRMETVSESSAGPWVVMGVMAVGFGLWTLAGMVADGIAGAD